MEIEHYDERLMNLMLVVDAQRRGYTSLFSSAYASQNALSGWGGGVRHIQEFTGRKYI